jgi:hypothetical protein
MTAKVNLRPKIPDALAAGNTVNAVVTIRDSSRYKEGGQHRSTLPTGLEAVSFLQTICKSNDVMLRFAQGDSRLAGPSLRVEGSKFHGISVRFRTCSSGLAQ